MVGTMMWFKREPKVVDKPSENGTVKGENGMVNRLRRKKAITLKPTRESSERETSTESEKEKRRHSDILDMKVSLERRDESDESLYESADCHSDAISASDDAIPRLSKSPTMSKESLKLAVTDEEVDLAKNKKTHRKTMSLSNPLEIVKNLGDDWFDHKRDLDKHSDKKKSRESLWSEEEKDSVHGSTTKLEQMRKNSKKEDKSNSSSRKSSTADAPKSRKSSKGSSVGSFFLRRKKTPTTVKPVEAVAEAIDKIVSTTEILNYTRSFLEEEKRHASITTQDGKPSEDTDTDEELPTPKVIGEHRRRLSRQTSRSKSKVRGKSQTVKVNTLRKSHSGTLKKSKKKIKTPQAVRSRQASVVESTPIVKKKFDASNTNKHHNSWLFSGNRGESKREGSSEEPTAPEPETEATDASKDPPKDTNWRAASSGGRGVNRAESCRERDPPRRGKHRNASDPNRLTAHNNHDLEGGAATAPSGSSSSSSLSSRSNESTTVPADPQASQSDWSEEEDPLAPQWADSLPPQILDSLLLDKRHRKRQEVIHELIVSEGSHVRWLKVLGVDFLRPLEKQPSLLPAEELRALFPNLPGVRERHMKLYADLRALRNDSSNHIVPIRAVADAMLGTLGDSGYASCLSRFCRGQRLALETLRERRRKNKELHHFLSAREQLPRCGRLQLRDLLACVWQRLTKYQLLLQGIVDTVCESDADTDEDIAQLKKAHDTAKDVLQSVDTAIRTAENDHRLRTIQNKLEIRAGSEWEELRRLDLTQRQLRMEGDLAIRHDGNKKISVLALMLTDVLVLLQREGDKFVLRPIPAPSQQGALSPLVKWDKVLFRPNAAARNTFFLMNINGVQMHELSANTPAEYSTWVKNIQECPLAKLAEQKPSLTPQHTHSASTASRTTDDEGSNVSRNPSDASEKSAAAEERDRVSAERERERAVSAEREREREAEKQEEEKEKEREKDEVVDREDKHVARRPTMSRISTHEAPPPRALEPQAAVTVSAAQAEQAHTAVRAFTPQGTLTNRPPEHGGPPCPASRRTRPRRRGRWSRRPPSPARRPTMSRISTHEAPPPRALEPQAAVTVSAAQAEQAARRPTMSRISTHEAPPPRALEPQAAVTVSAAQAEQAHTAVRAFTPQARRPTMSRISTHEAPPPRALEPQAAVTVSAAQAEQAHTAVRAFTPQAPRKPSRRTPPSGPSLRKVRLQTVLQSTAAHHVPHLDARGPAAAGAGAAGRRHRERRASRAGAHRRQGLHSARYAYKPSSRARRPTMSRISTHEAPPPRALEPQAAVTVSAAQAEQAHTAVRAFTPQEQLRRLDEVITRSLRAKSAVVAELLGVPADSYAQVADLAVTEALGQCDTSGELRLQRSVSNEEPSEIHTLLLAALTQANQLTESLTRALNVNEAAAVAARARGRCDRCSRHPLQRSSTLRADSRDAGGETTTLILTESLTRALNVNEAAAVAARARGRCDRCSRHPLQRSSTLRADSRDAGGETTTLILTESLTRALNVNEAAAVAARARGRCDRCSRHPLQRSSTLRADSRDAGGETTTLILTESLTRALNVNEAAAVAARARGRCDRCSRHPLQRSSTLRADSRDAGGETTTLILTESLTRALNVNEAAAVAARARGRCDRCSRHPLQRSSTLRADSRDAGGETTTLILTESLTRALNVNEAAAVAARARGRCDRCSRHPLQRSSTLRADSRDAGGETTTLILTESLTRALNVNEAAAVAARARGRCDRCSRHPLQRSSTLRADSRDAGGETTTLILTESLTRALNVNEAAAVAARARGRCDRCSRHPLQRSSTLRADSRDAGGETTTLILTESLTRALNVNEAAAVAARARGRCDRCSRHPLQRSSTLRADSRDAGGETTTLILTESLTRALNVNEAAAVAARARGRCDRCSRHPLQRSSTLRADSRDAGGETTTLILTESLTRALNVNEAAAVAARARGRCDRCSRHPLQRSSTLRADSRDAGGETTTLILTESLTRALNVNEAAAVAARARGRCDRCSRHPLQRSSTLRADSRDAGGETTTLILTESLTRALNVNEAAAVAARARGRCDRCSRHPLQRSSTLRADSRDAGGETTTLILTESLTRALNVNEAAAVAARARGRCDRCSRHPLQRSSTLRADSRDAGGETTTLILTESLTRALNVNEAAAVAARARGRCDRCSRHPLQRSSTLRADSRDAGGETTTLILTESLTRALNVNEAAAVAARARGRCDRCSRHPLQRSSTLRADSRDAGGETTTLILTESLTRALNVNEAAAVAARARGRCDRCSRHPLQRSSTLRADSRDAGGETTTLILKESLTRALNVNEAAAVAARARGRCDRCSRHPLQRSSTLRADSRDAGEPPSPPRSPGQLDSRLNDSMSMLDTISSLEKEASFDMLSDLEPQEPNAEDALGESTLQTSRLDSQLDDSSVHAGHHLVAREGSLVRHAQRP
ncbi:uncharacterized protein LOC134801755 [Cydia splendana]|uniref:uncharacterized protein LOC134801755 n=1 Tax=Cydia splendana TaxID=1100963 RepID=UPI00300CC269